jgi:hypothetical protein
VRTTCAGGSWQGLRPVVLAWALLATLTGAPYVRAWLRPPPGTVFLGAFYYVDDTYNYLSYVEQAERGSFLFENKLEPPPRPRTLVNLEWWLVGQLSAALGGRPFLAYRLLALLAAFVLVAGVDRWLRAAGLPASHRLPGLMLVGLGAGFGGVAWRAGLLPLSEALDLRAGLFPFVELLANPHFVLGSALLSWSALAFLEAGARPRLAWVGGVLGTLLGLVRPYELVLLVGARTLALVLTLPAREWLRGASPLLGLVPVGLYNAWVFFGARHLSSFARDYAAPSALSLVLALGPAAALAGISFAGQPPPAPERSARLHLWGWAAVALAIAVLRPVGYPVQFLVGIGVPLLTLGAAALSRFPRHVLLLATLGLSGTAAAALGLVLSDNPRWYVPPQGLQAGRALRGACRPGDLALAPAQIGLFVLGLTACDAFVSHAVATGYPERAEALAWFLGQATPRQRADFLARERVTFVVLPSSAGTMPEDLLGPGTPFRPVPGGTLGALSVYGRPAP